MSEGCDFGGRGHPAREIGLEGPLVYVTVPRWFAGNLVHDGVLEEDAGGGVEEAVDAFFPLGLLGRIGLISCCQQMSMTRGGFEISYLIPHDCRTVEEDTGIVAPLDVVKLGAVQSII